MKKAVILFIMLVLFLFGCGKNTETSDVSSDGTHNNASGTNNGEVCDMREIIFTEGVWHDKEWNKLEFPFENDCIPDKETAIILTKVFLENFQRQNYFTNYVAQSVFYDTEDRIWIVSFSESKDYPGAVFSIAIREDNAEVVKMWVEE